MLPAERLREAIAYVERLRTSVHEKSLPASVRSRVAASCLAIAQDHHHAIVVLIQHQLFASTFALLRVAFEAYVRGEWLALAASEAQVDRFAAGEEPPSIAVLLQELEQTPAFADQVLSAVKGAHWRSMCGYTHTGGLHVQRWNTEAAVEPNYDDQEVLQVLFFSELIGSLAALGVLEIGGHLDAGLEVLKAFEARTP